MKREVSMNDKKAIILQVLALNQVQLEKKQRKIEIYKCLQFTQGVGAYYNHQLADWILLNYFQLKANSHMFLQYGNLKYLSKQSRECIQMLFKKCQQKLGNCMSQDDFYTSLLMRNPYLGYQPLTYMYPPYVMPTMSGVPNSYPNTITNIQDYQKMYNRQIQQYYMQMSKYGYQMNPMYMPQMPYEMQQYGNPQNMGFSYKNFQSSYNMMQVPTQNPVPTSKANQKNLTHISHIPQPVSNIVRQPAKIIRQNLIQKPPQSLLANYKKPTKQRLKNPKNSPLQIKTTYKQMKQNEQYKKNATQTNQPICSLNDIKQDSQIQIIQKPSQTIAVQPKRQKKHQQNINLNPTNDQILNMPITVHYPDQNSQIFRNKMLEQQRIRKYLRDIKTILAPHPQKYQKQQFKYCVCNGFGDNTQFYTCTQCYRKFHYYCVGKKNIPLASQQNHQKCHFCFIKTLDPLNKVQKQIKTSYILDIRKNKFNQIIDFQIYDSYFNKTSAYQIQMRCLRLDDASNYVVEYTWPDQSFISINQQKTVEFTALQHNSSLKKRKDISIFLTNPIHFINKNKTGDIKNTTVSLQMKNITSLQSNQKRIKNNYIYVLGIYLTLKKTPDELCQQIINDPTNKINYVQKYFAETAKQQELQIQRIKVTLLDPFTWNIIDIPVRGRKCKHGQCFDLKTFLIFMNVQQVRQWKCPVCNRQCRNFYIDNQQVNVIKQYKKQQNTFSDNKLSKQVQFHRDGTTIFVAIKQQQQLDSKSKNNQQVHKTKKIVKTNVKEEKSAKEHKIEQEN